MTPKPSTRADLPEQAGGHAEGQEPVLDRRAERARSRARSGSTWIHCSSPVSSAKVSMSSCSTVCQLLTPSSWPTPALQVGQSVQHRVACLRPAASRPESVRPSSCSLPTEARPRRQADLAGRVKHRRAYRSSTTAAIPAEWDVPAATTPPTGGGPSAERRSRAGRRHDGDTRPVTSSRRKHHPPIASAAAPPTPPVRASTAARPWLIRALAVLGVAIGLSVTLIGATPEILGGWGKLLLMVPGMLLAAGSLAAFVETTPMARSRRRGTVR